MRRSLAQLLTLGLVALVSVSAAAIAAADPGILPRSTVDRADDSDGYQIKVLYVLPLDGVDRGLDTNGLAHAVIQNLQAWMANETGGRRFRFDTFQGQLDIGFARLPWTNAQILAADTFVFMREAVEGHLRILGFTHPQKIYLVLFEGGGVGVSCGYGPPGGIGGSVAILNLQSRSTGNAVCAFDRPGSPFGYFEMVAVHEILHVLGVGHVVNDTFDVMCSGSCPASVSLRRLDPGGDDYYGHGRPDRVDVARSAFLHPSMPPAEVPQNWLHGELPAASCQGESDLRSTAGSGARLEIVNGSSDALHVYSIDSAGQRRFAATVSPLQAYRNRAFVTHWVVTDAAERCRQVVVPVRPNNLVVVRDELAPPRHVEAVAMGRTVTVTWRAASGQPEGYIAEAGLVPGGAAVEAMAVAATTLTVGNVPPGVYFVRVRAIRGAAQSAASSEVTVAVPGSGGACTSAPLPPVLQGTAMGPRFTLAWTPAAGGCPATSFVVHAGTAPGASNVAQVTVGGQTGLAGDAPPGTYFIRVIGLNAFGASAVSNEVMLSVP